MTPLPASIRKFLLRHHVVGLATIWNGEPWAASCFYAFDEARLALVILSDEHTRHGMAMRDHPSVAGTIAGQPTFIPKIQGIQFVAQVQKLNEEEQAQAYALYCERHPIARLKRSTVWQLRLQEIKFTDNSVLLGSKTHWQREVSADQKPHPTRTRIQTSARLLLCLT